MGGTSRVSREAHARICERLGVKFPGPTRHRVQVRARPIEQADDSSVDVPHLVSSRRAKLIDKHDRSDRRHITEFLRGGYRDADAPMACWP